MSTHPVLDRLDRHGKSCQPPQQPRLVIKITPAAVPLRRKAHFENVLLETSSEQRRREIWAALFSVAVEVLLVSLVVLIPLWYTDVLPRSELATILTVPPPPAAPPPPPPAASAAPKVVRATTNVVNGRLLAPSNIPSKVPIVKELETPPSGGVLGGMPGGVPGGVPGGIPGGVLGGIPGGILSSTSHPVVVQASGNPAPKRIQISEGVTEGMILTKVQPLYPASAAAARIEGIVMLKAIIAKDGTIQNLEAVSGSPILIPAAIEAVRQWRYRPYLLNGQPVEVETTIQVTFQLGP